MENFKRTTWNYFSGSQLTFGPRAVANLEAVVGSTDAKRVFVVTDPALEEAGVVSQVTKVLESTSAEFLISREGEPEPSSEIAERVAEVAREFKPDLFVAVGGGSNMDLAKAIRSVVETGVSVESMFGFDRVPASTGPRTPLVCIPTTGGTGSEMSHAAVLNSTTIGQKNVILSRRVRPEIAIVDPYLTISCPPRVTAESGIDALTHAIEAYLVTNFYALNDNFESGLPYEGNNPFGDMLAEKAITMIGQSLHKAFGEPEDLGARSSMAFAATLAGAAFSNCGVSLGHGLEYPIGAKYGCSHGVGNGIVLPEVMRFWESVRQSRIANIGRMLIGPTAGTLSDPDAATAGIEFIEALRSDLGLPTCLADVGGNPDDIKGIAETTMSLRQLIRLSPRTPTLDDLCGVLEHCC